ncbi:hypothetical protein [Kitasatospora sp. KL5]|uniref:hypothetical protein n=1 Tax=Kitasatospora sp. KL5 TaxID=3425125 RepID=UPI003D6E8F21
MAQGSARESARIGGVRTTAKYEVDALVKDLIDQFSGARLPMPVVVLYAEDDDPELDREVEGVVHAVQEAQENGGLPYRVVAGAEGDDPHRNAVAILDGLSKGPWARRGPAWYRAYPSPRSRLVAAIEAAARHVLTAPATAGRRWTSRSRPSSPGCATCTGGPSRAPPAANSSASCHRC